ncbi:hypothetical protein E7T06_07180 [Deinococcus sp. Arct2-2]|uniref:hypothetical protein n=1 Tax=Deinococcus sp. Arct2-2 TaxID=2568653 RepID=UPI0010A40E71|nr:hypothetical protein [Deinococcus sp. Arct2-2]THF70481.1 hypothetical protein E7T06_07180 [Deinococcus sp. Arct2-2]
MRPRERKRLAKALLRVQAVLAGLEDPVERARVIAALKRRKQGYLEIKDCEPHYLRQLGLEDVLYGRN